MSDSDFSDEDKIVSLETQEQRRAKAFREAKHQYFANQTYKRFRYHGDQIDKMNTLCDIQLRIEGQAAMLREFLWLMRDRLGNEPWQAVVAIEAELKDMEFLLTEIP